MTMLLPDDKAPAAIPTSPDIPHHVAPTVALEDAFLEAAEAAGRSLPGTVTAGSVRSGASVLPVLVPGDGSLAVMTTLEGAINGTLILAVSARLSGIAVKELLGPKDLAFALEPPLTRALTPLARAAGGAVRADTPILLDSELALLDADLADDSSEVYAVALYVGRGHEATLVLVTSGAPALDKGVLDASEGGVDVPAQSNSDHDEDEDDWLDLDAIGGAEEHGWSDDVDGFGFGPDEPDPAPPDPAPPVLDREGPVATATPPMAANGPMLNLVATTGSELGRASVGVRELVNLIPGSLVALDAADGAVIDLRIGGRLVARGHVVVVDGALSIQIVELVGTRAPTPLAYPGEYPGNDQ